MVILGQVKRIATPYILHTYAMVVVPQKKESQRRILFFTLKNTTFV